MDLYIVRHAIAFDRDPEQWPDDSQRPLTPRGIRRFRAAAQGARRVIAAPEVVLSSAFTRAWHTAEILEERARWPAPIRCEALERPDAHAAVVEALGEHAASTAVAVVGHEPYLHELASYLLTSDPNRVAFDLKKGSVTTLRLGDGSTAGAAQLLWSLTPKLMRALGT
jgi:phosphohistidine phosphatase